MFCASTRFSSGVLCMSSYSSNHCMYWIQVAVVAETSCCNSPSYVAATCFSDDRNVYPPCQAHAKLHAMTTSFCQSVRSSVSRAAAGACASHTDYRCKGKGPDTCYIATYMSQTRDQQRFTISEEAADWHEQMSEIHTYITYIYLTTKGRLASDMLQ